MRTPPAPDERRNARLFVTGAVVSSVGTTAMTLAAGIWVQELTGDASLAALVGACVWAPTLLGPVLGPLVDRRRRQPLLVQANLGAAAVVLALLLVPGVAGPWLVFVAMAAYGVGFVVLDAAEAALLPAAVGPDALARVNGQRAAGQESVKLVAPALGAGLFALAGAPAVVALDVATFLVAAGAIARLRAPEPPPSPTAGTRWRDEVVDGYRALRRMPGAWRLTLLGATALTLHALASGTTFALVSDVMGRSPATVGVLAAAQGAGSVAGGLGADRALSRWGTPAVVATGLAASAAGCALRATAAFPAVVAGAILVGAGVVLVLVTTVSVLQRGAPAPVAGRVMATAGTVLNVPVPVATAAGAGLVAVVDARVVLAGCALGAGAAALAVRRSLRRGPAGGCSSTGWRT